MIKKSFFWKIFITSALAVFFVAALSAQVPSGTYVPRNDNDEHNISYTLALKTENGNMQLAVILRGTDEVEWRENMDVAEKKEVIKAVRHYSFDKANKTLQSAVDSYIKTHELNKVDFFITGHSRGAAVANLFAVDLFSKEYSPRVVVNNISKLAPTIYDYYNEKLTMEPLHGLTGHLYNYFIRQKIPFHPKADPEEDKTLKARQSVNDTHQAYTYYAALITDGFNSK